MICGQSTTQWILDLEQSTDDFDRTQEKLLNRSLVIFSEELSNLNSTHFSPMVVTLHLVVEDLPFFRCGVRDQLGLNYL